VIAAEVDPAWVAGRLKPWQLSEAVLPEFLGDLASAVRRRVNAIDMLAVAPSRSGAPGVALTEQDTDHPRVLRARRYRDDVRVWTADGGVLVLGRGLCGRWELALEVEPAARGRGLGRELARAATHLVDPGATVWAQVSPGNAASVRAILAAGYRPVGVEALLV
jgi:GNAT superfamily N-acetyltransferase